MARYWRIYGVTDIPRGTTVEHGTYNNLKHARGTAAALYITGEYPLVMLCTGGDKVIACYPDNDGPFDDCAS